MTFSFLRGWILVGVASSAASALAGPFDSRGSLAHFMNGLSLKSDVDLDLTRIHGSMSSAQMQRFSGAGDALRLWLEDKGLHPYIATRELRRTDNGAFGLSAAVSGPQRISDFEFIVGTYPVCGVTLRVVEQTGYERLVVGSIPLVDQVTSFQNDDWPDANGAAALAISSIAELQNLDAATGKVAKASRCVLNEQGALAPVWDLVISFGGLQYTVWSTPERIAYAAPRHFDSTTVVRAYDPNPISGALKDFTVEVDESGTLTNEHFLSYNFLTDTSAAPNGNSFVYDDSDPRFAEASAFAYANRQYDFVKSLGYTWSGPKPVKIAVHASGNGLVNNAYYSPSVTGEPPVIFIGDGDGKVLRNLAFDADVVAHEFGHHVVLQSITSRVGESLILHEGLADFLAMSRSGNACLGESVCPDQSAICYVRSKCLRTAENTLNYADDEFRYHGDSHRKGQLVSGFLWDLRKRGAMPSDTLTSYVLEAIPYLPANAGFKSLVASMLYVAQKHQGVYQNVIVDAATARGLSPENLDIYMTDLTGTLKTPTSNSDGEEESGKRKNFLGCGSIGIDYDQNQESAMTLVILLFALPLATSLVSKFRRLRS